MLSGVDTIVLNLRFRNGALGRLLFAPAAVEFETPYIDVTVLGTEGTIRMEDGQVRLRGYVIERLYPPTK